MNLLRDVDLAPDYFGFRIASKEVWVRYGLAVRNGTTDSQELTSRKNFAARDSGKRRKKKA